MTAAWRKVPSARKRDVSCDSSGQLLSRVWARARHNLTQPSLHHYLCSS